MIFFIGICHYDIAHILLYYIYECKLFTLEELNICKNNFNYGQIEIGNMSPPIKFEEHLQKKKFKMSARQMMTFTHFLPLMIGHFIPKNDEVWAFFLGLLKIIDIIMSFKISKSEIILLRLLIKEHNEQFTRLFKDTLKPKFHLLVHYPTVIEHSGPPRKFWCFRYESKHKEFKIYAHAITSRKNICLTLAKKNQMKFASFLLENHAEFQVENCNKITSNFSDFISNQLGTVTDEFTSYSKLDYKGTTYKIDYFLTKFTDDVLQLYKIIEIIMTSSNIYILCENVSVIGYVSHYNAYEVTKCPTKDDKGNDLLLINIKNFSCFPVNTNTLVNGEIMVIPKEYL